MPVQDVLAWSFADLGIPTTGTPTYAIGDMFTVGAGASGDVMTIDDTTGVLQDNPPGSQTQTATGTLDGVAFPTQTIQAETSFWVTDGTNTFWVHWMNPHSGSAAAGTFTHTDGFFVTEAPNRLVPGQTYELLGYDFAVNINFGEVMSPRAEPSIPGLYICFAKGTRIATPNGDLPVERLVAGDRVLTKDNGIQVLRWVGSRTVPATGDTAPICFEPGAIGNERRLRVSPQHRMVVSGSQAELHFGEPEVLVAAKHLVDGDRVHIDMSEPTVTYCHILFDHHQIVFSEGVPSESFHPGDESLRALDDDARSELLALFPQLAEEPGAYGPPARTAIRGYEAQIVTTEGSAYHV